MALENRNHMPNKKEEVSLKEFFSYREIFSKIAFNFSQGYETKDISIMEESLNQLMSSVKKLEKDSVQLEILLINQLKEYSLTTKDVETIDINTSALETVRGMLDLISDLSKADELMRSMMSNWHTDHMVMLSAGSEINMDAYINLEVYQSIYMKIHELAGRILIISYVFELGKESEKLDPNFSISNKQGEQFLLKNVEEKLQQMIPAIKMHFNIPGKLNNQPHIFTLVSASEKNLIFSSDIIFANDNETFDIKCSTSYDFSSGKIIDVVLAREGQENETISLNKFINTEN